MIGTPSSRISFEHIFAKSVGVGELRARIVNALVNRASQMLKKRSEQIAVEWGDRSPGVDVNLGGRS